MNTIAKLALAASAAAMFSTAIATPVSAAGADDSPSVKCMGINSCKGTSKCKTANNACAGQNSCKGKGWIAVPSEKECAAKGGTVVK